MCLKMGTFLKKVVKIAAIFEKTVKIVVGLQQQLGALLLIPSFALLLPLTVTSLCRVRFS